jgi:sigma-B regulation protein RsbU (phosphoserine phosphatase)
VILRALFLVLATIVPLSDGWQYVHTAPRALPPANDAGWQDEVEPRVELELWYRHSLPAPLPRDAHLVFRSYGGAFELYVDQREIYAFRDAAARGRLRLHDVPLPNDASGRTLYVRVLRGERPPLFGGAPLIATRAGAPLALLDVATDPFHDDLIPIVIAIALVILGVLSFAISRLRRTNGSTLFWFGLFTVTYGLRGLVDSYLPALLGFSIRDAEFVRAAMTYVINVPGWMLAREFIGRGWRDSLRWQVFAFAAFAPIALIFDIVQQTPESLRAVNNVLVILGGLNVAINLLYARPRQTHELRVISIGAGVFLLFAVMNNLSSLGVLPFDDADETFGFVIFVAALGYAATRNFLRGERERVALDGELATAREIQRSILPAEMPSIDGLRFATRYVPATSVAGDVYDFVATEARRTSVLVADVAGHGVPAALIASMVKIAVSSQQSLAHDPAAMLQQLNHTLKREVRRTLVTATFLHLDMETRIVRVANAGHAPPLLMRNRAFSELGPTGVLLGRFGDVTYTAADTRIERGDRIIAWTDGIIEARNAQGEPFGEERMQNVLRDRANGADAVIEAVEAWRHRDEDADDLTIVVIDVV